MQGIGRLGGRNDAFGNPTTDPWMRWKQERRGERGTIGRAGPGKVVGFFPADVTWPLDDVLRP